MDAGSITGDSPRTGVYRIKRDAESLNLAAGDVRFETHLSHCRRRDEGMRLFSSALIGKVRRRGFRHPAKNFRSDKRESEGMNNCDVVTRNLAIEVTVYYHSEEKKFFVCRAVTCI